MPIKASMLQRAIAHYRLPLFKLLQADAGFEWTFYCGDHDEKIGTGLPAPELVLLNTLPIRNHRLCGPFWYQSGVRLRGLDAFVLDLGWPLLSTPRYLLEARARGTAVVGWSKGIPQNQNRRDGLAKRLYQKAILSLCDALVLYGDISREYFLNLGFPDERMFVARNTIDTRRIAAELAPALAQKEQLLQQYPLGGRFVFGYLGALVPRKRVECVVAAFNQVRALGVDAVLVIAGGGTARPQIDAAAEASPYRSDIILPGRVPVGEEGGWFQLFDVFLSFAEGGLGILEAMAHGKVVVSTPERYPETELLADGHTALLSTDFAVESFAARMAYAAGNRDQLPAIGQRARGRVLAEATLDNMVAAIRRAIVCGMQHRTGRNVSILPS